ncbi:hypothetical protein CTheo_7662 [Ceratobasidium theobromae]|uniref:GST N-terminal domain-containing protein n=1 Tax=Ceratobasidium theobromae TaxID=1582974 RepID=A0A5N5QBV2_9AGAM|nr:hypothetical protein CTheo_7662 [Ceratobasidium theobromae]
MKKMRVLPKDIPQCAQRGLLPWQITEYRQVYCLDRLPDGQLPDAVIHIHVEWVWRTRKLSNIENPPQVLAGDYVWVIGVSESGYNDVELGVVKEILHYRDSSEQGIVTEILKPIPALGIFGTRNLPTHTRIYPTKYEQIYDMKQGHIQSAGFESYEDPVIRRVPRSKMELMTTVNEGASWVEVHKFESHADSPEPTGDQEAAASFHIRVIIELPNVNSNGIGAGWGIWLPYLHYGRIFPRSEAERYCASLKQLALPTYLMEELEISYEIKKWERTPEMLAPKELKEIHPLGNSPIISDGGLVLAESGAIVEYLITKYGNGRFSPSQENWVNNLYYTHYAEGTLMPQLVNLLIFTIVPDRAPLIIRPILRMVFNTLIAQMVDPRLTENSKMIEGHLAKNPGKFFAGGDNLTSADFMMLFPLEAWRSRGAVQLGEHARAYVEAMHARPAYKRALEKGGKYSYA